MEVIATKLSDMKQDHMLANSANKLNKNILKERSDEFKAKLDDFKNANNEKRNDLSKIVPAEIDIFKNDNDKIPTKNMPVFFKNCIDEINNNERLTLDNITREKNISIQNRDQAKTFKDEKQVAVDNAQKEFDNLVQEERKFYQNQIDYNKNTAEHKSTVISAKDITNTKVNGIGMISKISGVELNANSTPENLKKAFDKIYINGLSANEFFDIKETENLKEQYENAGNKLKQYFASLQNGDEKKNELDGCSISVENDKGMLDTVKMEIVPGELPQKPVEPSAWKFWEKKDYEKQLADYNENITKYNRRLEALSDFNESADIVTNSMNSTRVEFAKLKLDSINKEVAEKTAKKPEKTTGEQEKTTEEAEKTPEEIKKEVHKMKLEEIISKSRGEKTLQQKTKPVAEKEENTAEKDKDNNKEIQSPAKK
jgi:hypothetical protein